MPAMSKNGALTTGHEQYPPSTIIGTQTKVFADGVNVLVEGDAMVPHQKISKPFDIHGGTVIGSTAKVFVGGKKAIMISDKITCGDFVAMGSNKVFIK